MINNQRLQGLALCKRNQVRSVLYSLVDIRDSTCQNIEKFLEGYDDATNDIVSDNVPFNTFEKVNRLDCTMKQKGYLEAISSIAGVLIWEKERDGEREEDKSEYMQEFERNCDIFDKVFYTYKKGLNE